MTASELPREGGSSLAHALTQIRSGKERVRFGKGEKEEICGFFQPPSPDQLLSDRPEQLACLCQDQTHDKARHLAEACQSMGALQTKAHQSPVEPILLPGALRKGHDHRSRRTFGALELAIRRVDALLHLQIAGEQSKHVGGVLRPAQHAQVEFTDPLMAVLTEEARDALLQGSGESSLLIVLGEPRGWCALEQLPAGRIRPDLL